ALIIPGSDRVIAVGVASGPARFIEVGHLNPPAALVVPRPTDRIALRHLYGLPVQAEERRLDLVVALVVLLGPSGDPPLVRRRLSGPVEVSGLDSPRTSIVLSNELRETILHPDRATRFVEVGQLDHVAAVIIPSGDLLVAVHVQNGSAGFVEVGELDPAPA